MKYEGHSNIFQAGPIEKNTQISYQIKLYAEVERIWLLYDIDENGFLDYDEVKLYLSEQGSAYLKLNEEQKKALFDQIDKDGSGAVDKDEMIQFLSLIVQTDSGTKQSFMENKKIPDISSLQIKPKPKPKLSK